LLPDGQVLVAGGSDGNAPLTNAELYNPATGQWTATGNAAARFSTATSLLNGKVLVVGAGTSTAQLYDPATGSWTGTGSLQTTRNHHTATLLPNGKVLVAGGFDVNGTEIAIAELYNPATGTWSVTGSLGTARDSHTATLLANGKVLVAGGYIFTANYHGTRLLDSAELYDPATGKWTPTGNLTFARYSHTATLLSNGQVLVAGNNGDASNSAELFDPATGSWNVTGALVSGRANHTATLLPSGSVLVVGGTGSGASLYLRSAEIYNPATGSWASATELLRGRALHTATLLSDGRVLVAGGYRNGVALSSTEIYDPSSLHVPVQLQNVATRLNVSTADKVLIGGFIVTGDAPKKVMLRTIGPSLPFSGNLADPILELHLPSGAVVTNDNWKINDQTGQSQEAEIRATTIPPPNDLESAMVRTLSPGNYTAIVKGKNNGEGIGLIEVYDLDQSAPSELANISTRGFVNNSDNVMIGGFILGPADSGRGEVLVRAMGPSLPGVTGALADPTLELHNGNGDKIAFNDNWAVDDSTGQSQAAQIYSTTLAPNNQFESAILITLPAGNYTAIVAGKGGTAGIGLIEVYNLH
jgi:N-acetylneuraminic acid mutarotase